MSQNSEELQRQLRILQFQQQLSLQQLPLRQLPLHHDYEKKKYENEKEMNGGQIKKDFYPYDSEATKNLPLSY